jgi:hypothetical protein
MTWDGPPHVTKAWGIWVDDFSGSLRGRLISVYQWTYDQPVWQKGYRLGAFRTQKEAKRALAEMRATDSATGLTLYTKARVVRLTITTVADA